MVFESVVTDVLNKILGDYVENLDSKQLKIGIWGGDVVLHNLKLRENALDDLDLPVQLVYGYLGKLVLKIPWKNLYSQPVVAQIEDFYILVSPKQSVAYDADKEEKYDLQTKQAALQILDDARQKELDKDKPKPDASFTEKLTAQIVNNLQVTIARVHIRYEDTTTTGSPFAFGITLSELEICTTDENWAKCYLAEQVSRVYKIANLDSLCAYMNCSADLFSRYDTDEIGHKFKNNIAQKNVLPENYCYVLAPISSIAKLQLNMNPQYDDPPFKIPKIDLFLEMDKLNIGVTSTQFQNILKLADSMNRMQLGAPYRKYRPYNIPYKGHSKEWWTFAITSVLEEQVRRKNRAWTWEHMKNHRELCNTYAEAYKEKQLSKKPTATLIETCTFIEQKLDLFNLILIRQRIQFEVDKIKKETESKAVQKGGWFSGWFGSGKKETDDEPDNIAKKFEAAMTEEEREKLYNAIGYQENAAPLDLPKEYEAMNMHFKLIALEIGLYDDSKERKSYNLDGLQTIMLLKFSMTTCSIQQRPAASALSLTAGVKEMKLSGLSKPGLVPPTIIESKITDELNLLDIFFETNPLDGHCDQRVKVRARPLQFVYDSDTLLRLIKVFSPQQSVNLSELEVAASERMANFKERSSTGLQYMIDQHSIIEVDVQFMPNILILPGTGTYIPGATSVIVVSLGKLQIASQPHKKSFLEHRNEISTSKDQNEMFSDVMERAYDKFKISMEDIQVLVATPKENWVEVLENAIPSEMHVLRPTTIIVDASVCVVDDDPRLPKTKVEILLPAISLNITEDRIFEALEVALSIPLPKSEAPAPAPLKRSISRASLTSSRLSLPMLLNQERKKPKIELESSISEVVQYTSLELNFALKEINITLYKSCHSVGDCMVRVEHEEPEASTSLSPVDSNAFGTPEEELPTVNQHNKSIIDDVVPDSLKIISLQILQLEAQMSQRTYETVATVKLGAIHLQQHDHCDEKDEYLSIIDTPRYDQELEYLLTVSYTMANKSSPEFKTKYNCIEQLIVVNFTTLNVILHQECLLHLMKIANTLQNRLDEMNAGKKGPKDHMASADTEGIVHKLAAIVEEHEDEEQPIRPALVATQLEGRKRRQAKVVDCIKFSVVANLEQVGLLITCRKRPLTSLQIQDFNAGVILKTSYTELNLRLKNILVTDLNPNTIHTSILSIVGNNAFNCQVVMYNLDETSNYNSDDMKINVEIGCMKIVFLNWFVTSVMNFLNNFQAAQEALANASVAAADAARQNALDAYEKATRMKLNIRVKAPLIVVPMDSNSTNGIALDLGYLVLSNTTTEIPVPGNENNMAVLDEIKLELKDMKLSKVAIINESDIKDDNISLVGSIDTLDRAYGVMSNVNILNPVSCILNVKRNLSSSWYKDIPEMDLSGRLKSIEFNLFMEDYGVIMSILNRNLNEGVNEFPPAPTVKQPPSTPKQVSTPVSAATSQKRFATADRKPNRPLNASSSISPSKAVSAKQSGTTTPVAPHKPKITEKLKFNFQFDGIIANLLLNDNESLARFGLYFLSVKGTQLENGTLSTSVVLCNVQIDDTRSNTKSKITKYLCRKDWKGSELADSPSQLDKCHAWKPGHAERNFMVDVTAIIKETDTFAEVRVCGFDLILCIDFLMKLANFFKLPEDAEPINPPPVAHKVIEKKVVSSAKLVSKSSAGISADANKAVVEKKMNLMLHIEEPDIILVESLEDIHTNAIIFNMQVQLNYRALGEKQLINGQIDALKMYMCAFMPERREATRHYILHPCLISLQGSTPEEEGLHISLKMSDIIINVSPATIELLNKAMQTISIETTEQANTQKKEVDYGYIWSPHKFKDSKYWFIKVDQAEDALEALTNSDVVHVQHEKTERCVLEVPCITLVIETGVGYYTTPLLVIDTRVNAIASDWNRNLKVKGSLTLSMNYYNQALAVWEPIIELNERVKPNGEKDLLPWELNFKLEIEEKKNEFDEESEDKTTSIVINSDENMELTLSKTCLDLLSVLGAAFSQAIEAEGLAKPEVIAPYLVENDTGFDITLNFKHGIFTLHECHMPNASTTNMLNRSLVFQADEVDANFTPEQVKNCTISPGGHVYLQTKDLSTLASEEDEEYNVYVKVGDIDKEIILPVTKSDKRFFPLMRDTHQDPWGVLSEVRSEFGTTKLNIHGVVKVQNHFTANIKIYRNHAKSFEKLFVGEVAPGETYHVPLHAIYAETKELFFALEGYNVSIQGIKWNDCPTDLDYKRNLQCDPIETFEPLYIFAVREKTEVFYEHTNKFKLLSVYYTIHLKPPLYLRNALPITIKVSVAGCSVRQNGIQVSDTSISDTRSNTKEDMLDYGEKEVNPGDVLHLPTVRLASKSKENKSYLVVRLLQYLEKDWSCTTEIFEEHEELDTWNFSSYDSAAKMDMSLCVRYEKRGGSDMLTLYSPFWMINKTGLMLSYKTDTETVDVLYHPPEYNGPILFSFREKLFFDKKRATIRIDNGEWSDKIPLDVAGSIGGVTCKSNDQIYQIGVHNHLTHNSLTKQITFIPFYIATNKCEFAIELQEQSRPGDPWIKLETNAFVPIWPKNDSDHMIVTRVDGLCAVAFNYSEVQCTLLKLEGNKAGGINVDVQTTEGGVYITFTQYNPGDAPGLFINHTSKPIVYYEKGRNYAEHILKPHHEVLYTWVDPAGEKTLAFGKNKIESDLRRDDVGEIMLADDCSAFWVSFLDGLQRVILFTEEEAIATRSECSTLLQHITQSIEVRIHGIGISLLNNETGVDILYLGITSSGIIWESRKETKKRFKQMNIHDTAQLEAQYQHYLLDKIVKAETEKSYMLDNKFRIDFDRMLLNKSGERIIQRTFYPGVWISMNSSPFQTQLHAKINKVQLDNQLADCIFPVVLAPIAPPKSVATTTALKPFVECSMVQRLVPNSTVKQFKYASMLIQEFHFKVDLLFLTALSEMFSSTVTDEQAGVLFNQDVESIQKPLSSLVETQSMQEQKNFYDNLHLGPLKIHVSFSMAGSDTSALPGLLSTLVQGVGVTLTDVNDVVFRLAFFERQYQFFTQRQLTTEITAHYTGQALKQLYVLVLGLDVLGNPYGLVVGLKKGVEDLFYEPFQGAIQGPGEFAEGLVLGVKSLFGHTVGGAAGAVSKITGAMGKGLAALTFDEEYQKKRRQQINKKPSTFHKGIARSSKGLVMGFVDGVTGVVTKPVSGAKEEGVEGFFKGLGKGAIGLVTRPTAGVVDFASGSFEAVKRATESSEEAKRLRPPRFLHQDNVLRPYSYEDAKGNKLLKEIEKGKYSSTDVFVHAEDIVEKQEVFLVSNHRIIYACKNAMFGNWTVAWTYLWHEIASVVTTDRGVDITLKKKEDKKVLGLFSSHDTQHKLLMLPQVERRQPLAEIMESQRNET